MKITQFEITQDDIKRNLSALIKDDSVENTIKLFSNCVENGNIDTFVDLLKQAMDGKQLIDYISVLRLCANCNQPQLLIKALETVPAQWSTPYITGPNHNDLKKFTSICVEQGHLWPLKLLENRFSCFHRGNDWLSVAIRHQRADIIEYCIPFALKKRIMQNDNFMELVLANNLEMVKMYLNVFEPKKLLSPRQINSENLYEASRLGYLEMVKILHPWQKSDDVQGIVKAITAAIRCCQQEIVEYFTPFMPKDRMVYFLITASATKQPNLFKPLLEEAEKKNISIDYNELLVLSGTGHIENSMALFSRVQDIQQSLHCIRKMYSPPIAEFRERNLLERYSLYQKEKLTIALDEISTASSRSRKSKL